MVLCGVNDGLCGNIKKNTTKKEVMMILYNFDYVGGNIFYGVYAVKGKGFFLGWHCGAFDKGEFPVNEVLNGYRRVLFADEDLDLKSLLERLKQHTEDSREDYQLEKDDPRLNFKFAWGMKKLYG